MIDHQTMGASKYIATSCLFCLTVLLSIGVNAGDVTMASTQTYYELGDRLRYLEDRHGAMTIDNVLEYGEGLQWRTSSTRIPNFGYSNSDYWFHVSLIGPVFDFNEWVLEVSNSVLDYISVYYAADGKMLSSYHTGDQFAFHQRPIASNHFVFPLLLRANKVTDVYIHVKTDGSLQLPLHAWQLESYHEHQQFRSTLRGLYYGIMLVMLLYNLFLYFSVRERSYLYYVFFVGSIVLFQISLDGVAFQYLWPSNPWWHAKSIPFFGVIGVLFILSFTRAFLQLWKVMPRLASAFVVLEGATAVMMLGVFFLAPGMITQLVAIWAVPMLLICIVSGIWVWWKNVSAGHYFVVSCSAFLVGSFILSLSKQGLLPATPFIEHASQIGAVMQVILLSMALADRINVDKRERMKAKQAAIKSLEQFRSLYENAIEGIFRCTLEGRFISANPAMASLCGYDSPSDMLKHVNDIKTEVFANKNDSRDFVHILIECGQLLNYEVEGMRKDSTTFWCSVSAKIVYHSEHQQRLIEGFVVDITQRKKTEEQLNFLACHDPLTGLVNRREFENRLQRALSHARSQAGEHTLLYMDLDQFKLVNDTCGHIAGDELLRQLAALIRDCIRRHDTLARLGGDEFGVLLESCSGDEARRVAGNIREAIQDFRFVWEKRSFGLGVSIGLVRISAVNETVKQLLGYADAACYAAKDGGRNRVHEYRDDDTDVRSKRTEMHWATRINDAIDNDHLVLRRQFIRPLKSQSVIEPVGTKEVEIAQATDGIIEGVEAEGQFYEILLRMRNEDGSLIPPGAFIPAAERYNVMPAVDRWVIRTVFSWLASSPDVMKNTQHCAINLSGLTLGDDSFDEYLESQFEEYLIPPDIICFEITETMAVKNLASTIDFMNRFKRLGCSFSLDDFGSGFSSYAYLKNLPVDFLKIDGVFVKDIVLDEIDYAMVESINRIGHVMGKQTIAEFVESEAILERLQSIGVDYVQGYGVSKPETLSGASDESEGSSDLEG